MSDWSDTMIKRMAEHFGLIEPFSERVEGPETISWGLQPASYDVRLAHQVKIFNMAFGGSVLDPLHINEQMFIEWPGEGPCLVPAGGFAVGMTIEKLKVPRYCQVSGASKVMYTKAGLNIDVATIHPGFEGHLILHIANVSPFSVRIYPGMGIVNLVFRYVEGKVQTAYNEFEGARFMERSA